MSESYFNNFNEEEDFSYLLPKFEDALNSGNLSSTSFTEEEYDFLINHYMSEDDGSTVFTLAELAYKKHPYSVDLLIRYADVLIVNKLYDKALEILKEYLGTDAHNSDILFLYGRALSKVGEHDEGMKYIARAGEISSEDLTEMYITVIQDYIDEEDFDHALNYLKVVMVYDPDNYEILNDYAFCLDRTGDVEGSIEAYKKLLDIDPFNDYVWYNLGTMYSKVSNFSEAMDALDYSLALNSTNSSAMYNKALLCVNEGDFSKAVQLFEEFLTLEPDNVSVCVALADAYLTIGEDEKALLNYRRALEIDKNFIEANVGAAFVLMRERDYFGALVHLRKIMGKDEVDYNFIEGRLFISYNDSKITEYLVYTLVSLYNTGSKEQFYLYLDLLLDSDEIWLKKLFEYLPKAAKDKIVTKKIKQHKEGLSN